MRPRSSRLHTEQIGQIHRHIHEQRGKNGYQHTPGRPQACVIAPTPFGLTYERFAITGGTNAPTRSPPNRTSARGKLVWLPLSANCCVLDEPTPPPRFCKTASLRFGNPLKRARPPEEILDRVFVNYSMGKDLEGKPLKPAGQWPGPQSDLLGGRVAR
ncbi:hypothetical protein EYF80_019557 [Liparis tanakae]|uniref:Uncharacterized protein n=1 Tax=Liparis tanakae TaxID=230148 RepID=A0A4Z2HWF6_9TELE|nr:hypothetical protein EYF80_019557 [Liparis tanakae]